MTLERLRPEFAEEQSQEAPVATVRQAVIMAGGKGTRLYPYSALFPKPLMPLGDMPILELLLRRMSSAGVTDVMLAVNHLRSSHQGILRRRLAAGPADPLQQRGQAARHRRRAGQHAG